DNKEYYYKNIAKEKIAVLLSIKAKEICQQQQEQKEIILEKTKRQIEYLCDLYGKALDIDISDFNGSASEVDGEYVGSVSYGLSLTPVLEPRLEQRLELTLEYFNDLFEDKYIDLEIGEDLQSTKDRMTMINWVIPHEIAHIVDREFTITKKYNNQIENLPIIRNVSTRFAKDILYYLNEIIIDGLGYNLLMKYGTANKSSKTKSKRLEDVIMGFNTALKVLNIIYQNEHEENMSTWQFLLLRFITVGNTLLEEAISKKLPNSLIIATKNTILDLDNKFNKLTKIKSFFYYKGEKEFIMNLYLKYFQKAKKLNLSQLKQSTFQEESENNYSFVRA
ncbi:hypothetical protein ACFL56_02865, partial [Candidatus Margulisiibacteriota bacterium]